VYLAKDALEIGLIDSIGSFDDALTKAAELADLSDYKVREYPRYKSEFERFFGDLPNAAVNRLLSDRLPSWAKSYTLFWSDALHSSNEPFSVQARMPFELSID
ncbi:MAG: hypothetical protein O2937_03610, partial [Bacteroidetes bacterium]|nr:hypothetical protein [Bacteroidota bacterium]